MVGAMKGMRIIGHAGALALMVAATGASAQEGEAIKSILGAIGIIPKEKAPITYNERAPLVLPPKMDLPAPAAGGGAEARNGNWPKDPDVAARRKAAQRPARPIPAPSSTRTPKADRLSIEEMRAGRNPNNIVHDRPGQVDRQAEISRMSPDELRAFSKDEKPKLQGNGLDRRYLSDPPGDLLKAQGGRRLKASSDPAPMGDPDSPSAYLRQQQSRQ